MNNDNSNWDIVLVYAIILTLASFLMYIVVNLITDNI
jgi:hypothetical protein